MRTLIVFASATFAFAAGSWAIGWWAVPVAGLLIGAIHSTERAIEWKAAAAAAVGWAILLLIQPGEVLRTANVVGGVFGAGGFAFVLITLAYAAIVGGAGAGVGRGVLRIGRKEPARVDGGVSADQAELVKREPASGQRV